MFFTGAACFDERYAFGREGLVFTTMSVNLRGNKCTTASAAMHGGNCFEADGNIGGRAEAESDASTSCVRPHGACTK